MVSYKIVVMKSYPVSTEKKRRSLSKIQVKRTIVGNQEVEIM